MDRRGLAKFLLILLLITSESQAATFCGGKFRAFLSRWFGGGDSLSRSLDKAHQQASQKISHDQSLPPILRDPATLGASAVNGYTGELRAQPDQFAPAERPLMARAAQMSPTDAAAVRDFLAAYDEGKGRHVLEGAVTALLIYDIHQARAGNPTGLTVNTLLDLLQGRYRQKGFLPGTDPHPDELLQMAIESKSVSGVQRLFQLLGEHKDQEYRGPAALTERSMTRLVEWAAADPHLGADFLFQAVTFYAESYKSLTVPGFHNHDMVQSILQGRLEDYLNSEGGGFLILIGDPAGQAQMNAPKKHPSILQVLDRASGELGALGRQDLAKKIKDQRDQVQASLRARLQALRSTTSSS